MTIRWQEAELDETGFMAGHGMGFYRLPFATQKERRLIAFVEGFGWLRAGTDPVVRFAPERWPAGEAERAALRQAVENFLRGHHLRGEFAPGYFAFANA